MQIKKLLNTHDEFHSFQIRNDRVPQHHNTWHYHEELELIYIKEGSGTLFIGDCIQPFRSGTCVLIGKNIPHYWLFDELYLSQALADIYVIHFKEHFAGADFFDMPEMASIKQLLDTSSKALFSPAIPSSLRLIFEAIGEQTGAHRVIRLLEALQLFTSIGIKCLLISSAYIGQHVEHDLARMNLILHYIQDNFKSKIELETVANLSGMTINSFCRYFKQRTNRTLTDFISEMRITHACKILSTSSMSIKECCFESGFNNFVSFHKVFKKITGQTPQGYRKIWMTSMMA